MARLQRKKQKAGIMPVEKLINALDLPKTAMPGVSGIELSGNREAVIDGCRGILQYDDDLIKLSAGKLTVCFRGNMLCVRSLTPDQATIEGEIVSIEFLT